MNGQLSEFRLEYYFLLVNEQQTVLFRDDLTYLM